MENENTYNLRELALLLLSKIRLILLSTLLFALFAYLAARFLMAPRYESYTSMYVKNSSEVTQNIPGNINLSDLNASKSLVSTYAAVLMSSSVMSETETELAKIFDDDTLQAVFSSFQLSEFLSSLKFPVLDSLPFTLPEISLFARRESTETKKGKLNVAAYVKITSVNDTEVMRISALTKNPEVSAAICNIIAEIAPEFLIRVVGAGSVEVIDRAEPMEIPASPNKRLITEIGALLGMALSITVVLFLDFFDDTVRDVEQLTQRFEKPILGEIQSLGSKKKGDAKGKKYSSGKRLQEKLKYWLITDENIPFNTVEGYKTIRTNIMFALVTAHKKAFAISSPSSGDGKSTTAANTALAFAEASNRVLLIDGDMRKPVLHKIFKADNQFGLSTMVSGMSDAEKSIRRGVSNGLDLLPSGPLPPNPSELLSSTQFRDLLETFSQTYDYIIIDTPPVNVVSDAMVLRDDVGGVVIVVGYSDSTYADIAELMKRSETSGTNTLGFVVNNITESKSGAYSRYKYKYKYGYRYGNSYGYGGRVQARKDEDKRTEQQSDEESALSPPAETKRES